MTYIALTALLFLLRFALKGQPRLAGQLYPFVLALLFVFSAFRWEVGCDWGGYYYNYLGARGMDFPDALFHYEPLWWLWLVAQHRLGLPYEWANVWMSGIFFAGIHVLARRQPDPLGFLVLLFPVLIVNMPMSGIRQGAAIGLLSIALVRLMQGRPVGFAFWVLVGSGFHGSAIIFLLLTPLVARRITGLRLAATVLLAIPGALVMQQADAVEQAAGRYIDTGIDAFGAGFRILLLALSGLYFLMFLRRAWKQSSPDDYPVAMLGSVGMLGIGALLPVSTVIGDRLGYYLIPLQSMIFARVPGLSSLRGRQFLAALPYIGLFMFFVVWTMLSGHFQGCYLPYGNWLPELVLP